jgi:hypothetical protein
LADEGDIAMLRDLLIASAISLATCTGGSTAPTQIVTATPRAPVTATATAPASAPAPAVGHDALEVTQVVKLPGERPLAPISPTGLAIDNAGNVLISGAMLGTLRWGTTELTSVASAGGGPSTDAFVGSLDASLHPTWANLLGGPESDRADAVAASKDMIVSVGGFAGVAQVGTGKLIGKGSSDIFVTAFDPGGTLRFARAFGGKGSASARKVAIGPTGEVLVGGAIEGLVQFDRSPLPAPGPFATTFLAKLDRDGHVEWVRGFGRNRNSDVEAIAVDAAGNVVVGGEINAENEDDVLKLRTKEPGQIRFLMKLAPDGKLQWARPLAGLRDLAIVRDGIAAIAVPSQDEGAPAGSGDTLSVTKLSADGKVVWSKPTGADDTLIAVSASGVIVLANTFNRAGHYESFIATKTSEGEPLATRNLGTGEGDVLCTAVAVRASGAIVVMGTFRGEIDFGKGAVSAGKGGSTFLVELTP